MDLQVRKKDGSLQPFDRNKITSGLVKSGATLGQAEEITAQVETWVQTAAMNGVVSSVEIRTKALELLRNVNPGAAATFESYQKPEGGPVTPPPAGPPPEPPTGGSPPPPTM